MMCWIFWCLETPSCWKPLNKYLNSNSLRIKNWLNFGVLGVQYGIILNLTLYFICWSRNFVTNSLMWWFNWARHWPDQVVSSLQSSSDHRHRSRRPQSGTLGEKTDVRKMFFSGKNISNLGSEEKHRENMGRKSVRKKPGILSLECFNMISCSMPWKQGFTITWVEMLLSTISKNACST